MMVGGKQSCKLNPAIRDVPICKLSDFGLCRAVEANKDFYAMKSVSILLRPICFHVMLCVCLIFNDYFFVFVD